MRNTKYLLLAAGIVTGIVLLFYFGSGFFNQTLEKDEGIRYLIGVSQSNLLDPWQVVMNEEIKTEASKYPEVKVIFCDAAQDDRKQKTDLDNLVRQRVDLLIVLPNNPEFITETVSRIYQNGTPVIMMEYPVVNNYYTMLIFSDNRVTGRKAGELAADLFGKKGGSVLEIQGDPESLKVIERKAGFREALARYPAIKINYVVVGYWSMDQTEIRVGEIYHKKPKVDLVFAHNDLMAVGAWKVARRERIRAKFIGIEGLPTRHGGIEAVKEGILEATFLYPTGGREAVRYSLKILKGEKVPKRLELPVVKITKDTLPK